MSDIDLVRAIRADAPEPSVERLTEGRTRLLSAIDECAGPRLAARPAWCRPLWRVAIAGCLTLTIVVTITVVQHMGVDPQHPRLASVADARNLAARAARAAEAEEAPQGRPGQWLYIKLRQAPPSQGGGVGVDPDGRETWEKWTSIDGKQVAWETRPGKMLIQFTSPGLSSADLAPVAGSPGKLLARIRAAMERPAGVHGDEISPDEDTFLAINQLMSEQFLSPAVRAGLFRALPEIPGVQMQRDVADAADRHGIAFAYTRSWVRYDLILSPDTYRYLGSRGVVTRTHTITTQAGTDHYFRGSIVVWNARMTAKVVDKPGQRP